MVDLEKKENLDFIGQNIPGTILRNGLICLLFYVLYSGLRYWQKPSLYHPILLVAIFLILIISNFLLFHKIERNVKQHVSDIEMKALRSQMNPHFIFNSLNSINDYIDRHDTASAIVYSTEFSKLMRLVLENSEKKLISLADDLRVLELYMKLEAFRLKNKFTYTISVDQTIDQENTMVAPLILQPFVENSILHGISNKEGKSHILIEIKKEYEMINYMVEDDGLGRALAETTSPKTHDTGRSSMGMKITRNRINIINKIKQTRGDVEIIDLRQGTRVKVKLPLELSF